MKSGQEQLPSSQSSQGVRLWRKIAGLEVAKAASSPPFPEAWGAVNHRVTPSSQARGEGRSVPGRDGQVNQAAEYGTLFLLPSQTPLMIMKDHRQAIDLLIGTWV